MRRIRVHSSSGNLGAMSAHIFLDNSNVFSGARRAAETLEPDAIWPAVRVYYRNLFRLVEHGHHVVTRVMAGSVPPGNEQLWKHAKDAGYDTALLRKVEKDDGHLGEQGVDEMLHLRIANALLDFDPPQTLVLVTGDGRDSDFGTSFPQQVTRALKRGWGVEVWSWREQFSNRFRHLQAQAGNFLALHELDAHYRKITFVQRGNYEVGGASIKLHGRIVSKFRPT